jgi:hypothetical protein
LGYAFLRAMFRLLGFAALCAVLAAQNVPRGVPTKAAASEYPVQGKAGGLAIGAEYLVRSFSGQGRTFATDGYLVVEVALFPPPGETLAVSAGAFGLRINGQKRAILAQNPAFVAASLKYSDWGRQTSVEAHAGSGDREVRINTPVPSARFPGDMRVPAPRRPPRAPEENRSGLERRPEPVAHEIAVESALPEGVFRGPVAGFLYFPYSRKTRSLKSLELLYGGPAGDAALKLL